MLLSLGPAAVTVFARGATLSAAAMDSRMTTVRTRRHDGDWHDQSVRRPVRAAPLSKAPLRPRSGSWDRRTVSSPTAGIRVVSSDSSVLAVIAAEDLVRWSAAGSGGETRTLNPLINSQMLCRLSYPGNSALTPRRPWGRHRRARGD